MTPAGAWTKAFASLMAALIVLPVLATVPLAFSAQSFARLPPEAWLLPLARLRPSRPTTARPSLAHFYRNFRQLGENGEVVAIRW